MTCGQLLNRKKEKETIEVARYFFKDVAREFVKIRDTLVWHVM
jgi:hypothetical protein